MTTPLTVREVARLAGVTVRTLHHYDQIGLLEPQGRTESGYRQYGPEQLTRLHEILVWRSLGFPLDEVRALVDDPAHDPGEAMRLHRQRLVEQRGELDARIEALDRAIDRHERGEPLQEVDLRAIFDGFDPAEWADEANERWGHEPAYREAQRRTRRYGEREWRQLKAEARAVTADIVELLREGVPPDGPEARLAAEAHRLHIDRWFYECTPEIHQGLAEMYEADPRFRAHYEAAAEGLTAYLAAAIRALHQSRTRAL